MTNDEIPPFPNAGLREPRWTDPTHTPVSARSSANMGPMSVESEEAGPPGFAEPTFGQRLLGRLVDAVVVFPAALLIGAVLDGRTRAAVGLATVGVYEVVLVSRRGQTVGKIAMGTRIVDRASGSLPDMAHVVVRWLVLIAGSLVSLLVPAFAAIDVAYTVVVLLPVLLPPLHRGLHDVAARTVVASVRQTRDAT